MTRDNHRDHSASDRKNLRRISITISTQTLWHLEKMAATNGWSKKDLGRVVDEIMRKVLISRKEATEREQKRTR